MLQPRSQTLVARHRIPIAVGRGGLAPGVFLAALFAVVGARNGLPVGAAAFVGGVGGTLSLIVHELGHVSAARGVRSIRHASVSLIWLGAATRFEGRYANGRDQARVAIGGPQASLALALSLALMLFMPVGFAAKELALLLALFNVALALLNLVPAYPLDGYKVAVGILWSLLGSQERARRLLRRIGLAWIAVELGTCALLLVERPLIGILAALLAATFFGQKHLLRRAKA